MNAALIHQLSALVRSGDCRAMQTVVRSELRSLDPPPAVRDPQPGPWPLEPSASTLEPTA